METPIDFKENEWKQESNNRLKGINSSNRVININYIYIAFVLVSLAFIGVFYYLGVNDYFKSNLNSVCNNTCQATICPSIPACPINICSVNLSCGNVNATAISNLTFINNTYLNNTNHS